MKNNQGTAIILSLVIVSVLFILTSFLVRKVVTNTTMVEKAGEEQKSYALAKQGILHALDKLNTWDGIEPDYDPTDWLNGQNWDEDNWNPFDLNGDGQNDVGIRVDKDDIPHPENNDPVFPQDPEDNDNGDLNYITIESRDLPKKLVTLQAIAKNNSPLLDYVRFINSDVTFSSPQTFGGLLNGSPFHVNGNLTLTGVNNIYLDTTRNDKFEIAQEILATASSDTVNILEQTGTYLASNLNAVAKDEGNNGFSVVYDTENSKWVKEPENFNTASGHYFDGEHLPSSYDRSDPDNPQYVSGESIISWPQINEERYGNLADLLISASDCGNRHPAWNDWYPSDDEYAGNYASGDYWRQEESTSSYNYTPPGVHLIFSDTQDLDPSTSATTERLMRVNDDNTTDLPAEYETSASIDYSLFTSEDVIFCEKDVRVNGVLPRDLTIVSGGNIYIDSNIYTNSHSLALVAKENVLLNTTHRWVVGYEEGDNWNYNGTSATNLVGVTDDVGFAQAQVNIGESKEQILNFGDSTSAQIVTTDRIILRGCGYDVYTDNTMDLSVEVDLGDDGWQSVSFISGPSFPISGPASDSGLTIVLETPSAFRNFSRIRLTARGGEIPGETGMDPAGWIKVDAVEIPIRDMDRMAIFAENGSWYVIPGNGASAYNDQQEPFTLGGALSQEELEDRTKWNDGSGEADWSQITYVYDSDLATTPPPKLPPSINLVSLKRK